MEVCFAKVVGEGLLGKAFKQRHTGNEGANQQTSKTCFRKEKQQMKRPHSRKDAWHV